MAAEDGTITIGADTSGVRLALGLLEDELNTLDKTTDKTAKNLDKYGTRLDTSLGKKSGLMDNLKGASSILSSVSSKTSSMTSAVKMLGKEGASVGTRVQGGINLASTAVAAFAGPGGMIVGAITVVAGLAIGISELYQATQEDVEKTTEELEELSKAAEAANKSIFELEVETKLKEEREAIILVEEKLRLEQNEATLIAEKTEAIKRYKEAERELRRAQLVSSRSFLGQLKKRKEAREESAKRREETLKARRKRIEDEEKAEKDQASKRRQRSRSRQKEEEQSAFGGLRLLSLSGGRAVRIRRVNHQAERNEQERWEAEQRTIEQEAELAKRTAADKARADELKKERETQRSMLDLMKQTDLETAQWKEGQRLMEAEARKEEAKEREQEMLDLIKQSRDFSEVAQVGFSTVTSELFNMAKAGEFSAQKLLNATLTAIGQQMVAQGTQLAFEGAAKALAGDPRGAGIAAIGVAEIAAGVGLGAAAGSGDASTAAASASSGAVDAAPVDTRQTRAAAAPGGDSGGPVIIRFEGDVYDKRGVANVLNQGLGMARHRRLRGA